MISRRLRLPKILVYKSAYWALGLLLGLLFLTPTRANASWVYSSMTFSTAASGCDYAFQQEQATGSPGTYTKLGMDYSQSVGGLYATCHAYVKFTSGGSAYLNPAVYATCSGSSYDQHSPGGCSPSTEPQSGKLTGNDTCDCGGATPSTTGTVSGGEPIDIASGNVTYHFTDYVTAGQNQLSLTRVYNSRTTFAGSLGAMWRTNFDRFIYNTAYSSVAKAERPNGQQIVFNLVSGVWTPDADADYTLTASGSTWTLTTPDDTVEVYTDAPSGYVALPNSITLRNGYAQTLTYSTTVPQQLASVSDSYSRSLTFAYNTDGTLASVSTADSTTISFGYSTNANGQMLTSVSYPTSPTSTVTYAYYGGPPCQDHFLPSIS